MNRILATLCVIAVLFSLAACSNTDGRLSEGDENQQIQVVQSNKDATATSENESDAPASDVPISSNSNGDTDTSVEDNVVQGNPQSNTGTSNQTEESPVGEPDVSLESSPNQEQPPSQTETGKQPESSSASKPETQPESTPETQPETQPEPPVTEEDDNMLIIEIVVGSKTFTATLYDNEAAKALVECLPLTLNMSELNGNEKYYYLDSNLPTNSSRPSGIKAGDIMLYGNNCLVLFYESFSTSYSYTPLGHIDDPEGLAAALGSGSVQVTFRKG